MTLEELKDALLAADQAAVLVPGHLLARVLRETEGLGGQTLSVPHRKSTIIDRHVLFRHVDPDDLDLGLDRVLPSKVILLALPSLDRRHSLDRESTLLTYWRRLFHARVHLHLQQRAAEGHLGPADVESRIAKIGRTEFGEVKAVLEEEQYLLSNAPPLKVYIEFAAVFLELRFFWPDLLPVFFPALQNQSHIERLLGEDIDAADLFAKTRLAGLTEPPPRFDPTTDEPSDACLKLMREARRAFRAGNTVRAAILRSQAARIAPAALTVRLRGEVNQDLDQLMGRLQAALKLSDTEVPEWRKELPFLIEKTGEEHWSVETRLLYDLQKACVDHEREVYALDLVEWTLSAGKRPIKRPLPLLRLVHIGRHLKSAAQRLIFTRLSETDRQHLASLLHRALRDNEDRLRHRLRPLILDALQIVGLHPTNPAELAGTQKMVEELLDRIWEYGFFTYSDLRDAVSANNLKMPDLADPTELFRGDPLLRLDRLLKTRLDGVYHPSEFYLRFIQRVTSVCFGTFTGRLFTRFILLPVVGSLVLLEGLELIVGLYHKFLGGDHVPLFGPLSAISSWMIWPRVLRQVEQIGQVLAAQGILTQGAINGVFSQGALAWCATTLEPLPLALPRPSFPVMHQVLWAVMCLAAMGVLHVPLIRRSLANLGSYALRLGRHIFLEWPARVLPIPVLRRFYKSWPFQFILGLTLRPLPVCALIWFLFPPARSTLPRAVWVFLIVALVMNSRLGLAVENFLSRGLVQFVHWLRSGLLRGLVRFFSRFFKAIVDGMEYVLYTVDEWLRFRAGDSSLSMIGRAVLATLWFPVSYLIRLYVVVWIEPGFNPIKAPLSLLVAKFSFPVGTLFLLPALTSLFKPLVGQDLGWGIAWIHCWLLADVFTFLVWETKENWKLYRANRSPVLGPVGIGPHGETLQQLLKPGFHSGTVPKLYSRWRRAEREAHKWGAHRAALACREKLKNLEATVKSFVERAVLDLVNQSPEWRDSPLRVGPITLATNLVRIEFRHAHYPQTSVRLVIAEQEDLLVAQVEENGWVGELTPGQRRTFLQAVAGLYKLAGVDLVQEQLQASLPRGCRWRPYDGALAIRFEPDGPEVVYDLYLQGGLQPRPESPPGPLLDPLRTVFGRSPFLWRNWANGWQEEGVDTETLPAVMKFPPLPSPEKKA